MAFKEVTDLNADTTVSIGGSNRKTGKKNPSSVEGYYLGRRSVADKKKKSGESFIYILQTPKGNIGVWGKTDMDRKMGGVPAGAMIRISFDKMVPTPNGEMYKYKVEVDVDNSIEVTASSPSSSSDDSDNSSDDGSSESEEAYDSEGYTNEEAEEQAEEEDQTAALAAAKERQAKVQALLKGGARKTATK